MAARHRNRQILLAACGGSGLALWSCLWLIGSAPDRGSPPQAVARIVRADVDVQHLAQQIRALPVPGKIADADAALREQVRSLSIRDAAELGEELLPAGDDVALAWVALAAEREQQSLAQLRSLVERVGRHWMARQAIRHTLRGSDRLRAVCGEDRLAEVTGLTLQTLDDEAFVYPCDLTDLDLELLAGLPGLEELRIVAAPHLTDAGLQPLQGLTRLREVGLVQCANVTDAGLLFVIRSELRGLDLGESPRITDAGVESLQTCRELRRLNLERTGITSASLPVLARQTELRELNLSGTAVSEGLEQLVALQKLERLKLANLGARLRPVPDEGLAVLSQLKQLTELDLLETAARRVELRGLPRLIDLRLGHQVQQELTLADLPLLARPEIAPPWVTGPREMKLRKVEIKQLPALQRLVLPGLLEEGGVGLAEMTGVDQLQEVYLLQGELIDPLAETLGRLPNLVRLQVDAPVTSRQLQLLVQAPRLSQLELNGQQLKPEDYQRLSEMPLLERLRINAGAPIFAGEGQGWPRLTALHLESCRGGSVNLRGLPLLSQLDIRQGELNALEVVDCPQLVRISLLQVSFWQLTVRDCARLESLFAGYRSWLARVELDNLPVLEGLTFQEYTTIRHLAVNRLPRLRSVSFWLADLTIQVLQTLVDLPNLCTLDLSNSNLGDEAAETLLRMRHLSDLRLSPEWTATGLESLANHANLKKLMTYRRQHADWREPELRNWFPKGLDLVVFELGR